jgi:hypothetical protein
MTDGSWKYLAEASSAEVEYGILVCRNAAGDMVRTLRTKRSACFLRQTKVKRRTRPTKRW